MRFFALCLLIPISIAAQSGREGGGMTPPAGAGQAAQTGQGRTAPAGRARQGGAETGAARPQQASVQPSRPEDLGSVEGQVFDAASGQSLRKAELMLRRTDAPPGSGSIPRVYTGTTDSNGRFLIQGVEPGRYRLTARRNGFVSMEYGAAGPSRAGSSLAVDRAQNLTGIDLRLTPHGVVTGRIADADGEPMAGVQVQAYRSTYLQGRKQLVPESGATTNDLGEYRVYGLPPARYYIVATYRAAELAGQGRAMGGRGMGQAQGADSRESWAPTYYPGSFDPTTAGTLEITPGAELRNINMTLAKARTYRVRGQVSNNSGAQSAVAVMLTARNPLARASSRAARVNQEGSFDIQGVLPGSYILTAVAMEGRNPLYARRQLDIGSDDVDGIVLAIAPGVDVSGRVRVEDASALPMLTSVQVRLQPRDAASFAGMGGARGGFPGGTTNAGARVAEDGAFKLAGISPDLYAVSVSNLPEGFYVRSARSGQTDVLLSGLEVGSAAVSLEISLRPNAGQVSGLVLNPDTVKAAPGAIVALVPQEPERQNVNFFYRTATTDQYGQFTVQNVAPGSYKAYAWDAVESGAYMDPEFMKPLETMGQAVSVRESGQQTIQLTLIPGDTAAEDDR